MRTTTVILFLLLIGIVAPVSASNNEPVLQQQIGEAISILNDRALTVDEPFIANQAVLAMLKAVDPKGIIASPDQLYDMLNRQNGNKYYAGIRLSFTGETVTISNIVPESPAEIAGLQTNDTILSIGGQAVDGLIPPEIISLLRGQEKQTIQIEFQRKKEKETIELTLSPAQLSTIEAIEYFPEEIIYVMANGFFNQSGSEMLTLLKKWKKEDAFGVILDLRQASGRDIQSVQEIGDILSPPKTKLYAYEDKHGSELSEFTTGVSPRLGLPLMILVGENTTGASELLAVLCKNSIKGCMVLGSETSGTPLIREAIPMANGNNMYIATRKLSTPNNRKYDGHIGLQPDIIVTESGYIDSYKPDHMQTTLDEEVEDEYLRERLRGDATLSRATDLLLGLKALNFFPRTKEN